MTEPILEYRDLDEPAIEFRETTDGHFHFTGYAAVFNSPSVPLPYIETILPGAFSRTIHEERTIPLLVNHGKGTKYPLAASPHTMTLAEDTHGLIAEADIAPTSEARDLKITADAGNARHMSFAFKPTPKGERWFDGGKRRELSELRLHEVSILVGYAPGYRETTAFLRSLAERWEMTEPDDLALAIAGLSEGRTLSEPEVRLILDTVAELRVEPEAALTVAGNGDATVAKRHIPITLLQRRLALQEIRLD